MSPVSWHPYIVEDDEYKVLQFAEQDIQSKMRKAAPDELVLSYTQAMMAFMLFVEAPRHVLIGGLGGGSIAKFCHRHLPSAQITTVEISAEVIALRNEFRIPPDGERFTVFHGDFASFVAGKRAIADVILLDGYDSDGIHASLDGASFYSHCNEALTDNGMLVANINLGTVAGSAPALRAVQQAVGRTLSIRSTAGYNDILLAFHDAELPEVKVLKARAVALRKQTGLDFPLLLDKVRTAVGVAEGLHR